ncbi:hypothetical protein [Streptomyces sp. NPDC093225]|uniref:hypothetical protein n=1 Tax=Streptomyces sp. NPDC093225 TaxID=3366034 RepID=UPI00382C5CEA
MPTRFGWTGCHNCLALFYSGWPPPNDPPPYHPVPNGSCSADPLPETPPQFLGRHIPNSDWAFEMTTDPSSRGDGTVVTGWTPGFNHCTACEVIFSTQVDGNRCPQSGGAHAAGTSYQFPLNWGAFEHFKSGWALCGKCGAMFFADGSAFNGDCPVSATHHAVSVEFGVEHWL